MWIATCCVDIIDSKNTSAVGTSVFICYIDVAVRGEGFKTASYLIILLNYLGG